MKFAFALMTLISAQSVLASSEEILKSLDIFLAKDTFANAFKCGDTNKTKNHTSFAGEVLDYEITTKVIDCRDVIVMESKDEEETTESRITKAEYVASAGNPLRMFTEDERSKMDLNTFEWNSIRGAKINYLGAKRNAMIVRGKGIVCIQDDEAGEFCLDADVSVTIVSGVPYLARVANLDLKLPEWGISAKTQVTSFQRKP